MKIGGALEMSVLLPPLKVGKSSKVRVKLPCSPQAVGVGIAETELVPVEVTTVEEERDRELLIRRDEEAVLVDERMLELVVVTVAGPIEELVKALLDALTEPDLLDRETMLMGELEALALDKLSDREEVLVRMVEGDDAVSLEALSLVVIVVPLKRVEAPRAAVLIGAP